MHDCLSVMEVMKRKGGEREGEREKKDGKREGLVVLFCAVCCHSRIIVCFVGG